VAWRVNVLFPPIADIRKPGIAEGLLEGGEPSVLIETPIRNSSPASVQGKVIGSPAEAHHGNRRDVLSANFSLHVPDFRFVIVGPYQPPAVEKTSHSAIVQAASCGKMG
jgi:hypothetical protein